jgi:hypothetical protein
MYVESNGRGKSATVQAIIGALFAFLLETVFKRAIPVMFPSIQPTDLKASHA